MPGFKDHKDAYFLFNVPLTQKVMKGHFYTNLTYFLIGIGNLCPNYTVTNFILQNYY